jgi:hypothetical protein
MSHRDTHRADRAQGGTIRRRIGASGCALGARGRNLRVSRRNKSENVRTPFRAHFKVRVSVSRARIGTRSHIVHAHASRIARSVYD